jgi:hypothetical protein
MPRALAEKLRHGRAAVAPRQRRLICIVLAHLVLVVFRRVTLAGQFVWNSSLCVLGKNFVRGRLGHVMFVHVEPPGSQPKVYRGANQEAGIGLGDPHAASTVDVLAPRILTNWTRSFAAIIAAHVRAAVLPHAPSLGNCCLLWRLLVWTNHSACCLQISLDDFTLQKGGKLFPPD